MTLSAFSREDYFARNIGILLGIGTFWRLLYLMALVQKAHALACARDPALVLPLPLWPCFWSCF